MLFLLVDPQLFAQLTTASVLTTVESLIDKRVKDTDAAIEDLTDAGIGLFLGLASRRVTREVWLNWADTLLRLKTG